MADKGKDVKQQVKQQEKQGKYRNWVTVVYPDSAPKNWREILRLTGLKGAISPLHDADVNGDGHEKKAHWHVILCWDGPASYNSAKRVTDKLNAPRPEDCVSVKGYYRYLTHEDNPDKAQYSKNDIETFGGFNILDFVEMTTSEVERCLDTLEDLIENHRTVSYRKFIMLVKVAGTREEIKVARSHTMHLSAYIKSLRYDLMEEKAEDEPSPPPRPPKDNPESAARWAAAREDFSK